MNLRVQKYIDAVEEISEVAKREYALEEHLDIMVQDWVSIKWLLFPWKETGTFVLRDTDDIVTLIDDHLVKTQAMRSSPHVTHIKRRVLEWERKLQKTQNLLDAWLTLQTGWIQLSPIFTSDDIMTQLPAHARAFSKVDALWRSSMSSINAEPRVMDVSDSGYYTAFKNAIAQVDEVQKGLSEYLESKRVAFPRFFFLSDGELIQILSETKDPRKVNNYISKVFEGISELSFTEAPELLITGMENRDGDSIPFSTLVEPNKESTKGRAEKWMTEVENQMRESLSREIYDANEIYCSSNRKSWAGVPAQIALALKSIHWTHDVSAALRKGHLDTYASKLRHRLEDLVREVRKGASPLAMGLLVLDVHRRDVVAAMVHSGVVNADSFEWLKQLRHYYDVRRKASAFEL